MNHTGDFGRVRAADEYLRSGNVKRAEPSEVVIWSINKRFFFLSLSAYFLYDLRPYISKREKRLLTIALSFV